MLDHVSLGVADLARASAFYDAALLPLGYVRCWTGEGGVEYGPRGGDGALALFAMGARAACPGPGFHLALRAPDRAAVEAFHATALGLGAADEGGPGLRPRYGPGYYAAFVRDPDGHRLEAVVHEAAGS
jgi:catechol 2,3-dioxygenase-like lactoylglutathione lyase family enzyme